MGKTRLLVVALMVAALLSLAPAVLAQPQVSGFYGTVKAGGAAVKDGTIVRAWIGGQQVATTTTKTVGADSVYVLNIQGTDAQVGKKVEFAIGATKAAESGTYQHGQNVNVNLTFPALPSTGDVDLTGLWVGMAAVGALALAGGVLMLRRTGSSRRSA